MTEKAHCFNKNQLLLTEQAVYKNTELKYCRE